MKEKVAKKASSSTDGSAAAAAAGANFALNGDHLSTLQNLMGGSGGGMGMPLLDGLPFEGFNEFLRADGTSVAVSFNAEGASEDQQSQPLAVHEKDALTQRRRPTLSPPRPRRRPCCSPQRATWRQNLRPPRRTAAPPP